MREEHGGAPQGQAEGHRPDPSARENVPCTCGVGNMFARFLHQPECPCHTHGYKPPPSKLEIAEAEIVRLRAALAAAEGQARGSEAMLIQAQRDCDNAQNAELVALSQLAEMTTLRDKLAYAERTIEQRNEWINKITRMASDMERERDTALSLLAERDAQVGRDVKDAQRWRAFVEAEGQLFDYGAGTISAIMTWPESNPEPDAHSEIVAVLTRIVDSHIDAALATGPRATEEG